MRHVILISTFAVIATVSMSTGCSKESKNEPTEETEGTGATLEEENSEATAAAQTSEQEADETNSSNEPPVNVATTDERTNPTDPPADVAAPAEDAVTTATGLAIKVLRPGHGSTNPSPTDTVRVHYTGWTTDGNMFDSSVARDEPTEFPLNRVIPGWTEGLQLMVEGEKSRLWIPENLAYGGRPGRPAGMLVFDVELLEIVRAAGAPENVAAPPPDAEVTASGLAIKVITPGPGSDHPSPTDTVRVHYTGWTTDGNEFDSSVRRGEPASFPLDQVISGWTEGLQLMVEGEKARLWIPEELAYGGMPGRPAGMLVFDVELLEIVRAPSAPDDVSGAPADAAVTPSGLASRVLREGTGTEHPAATDVVMVHYSGWTTDGNMFDSSETRGQPATFALNRVIAGWTEGLQLMVVGEKRRLWIPEELAYGGMPGRPAGMLVFDVELLAIR